MPSPAEVETGQEPATPFLIHRNHLDSYRRARALGLSDRAYADLVAEADRRLASVGSAGFRTTPLVELAVHDAPEGVLAKVETGNVGGSHKARHLFGLLIDLLVDERTDNDHSGAELAIASCGNAAIGAAVVAKSAGRALQVFVPQSASTLVLDQLDQLGATVVTCHRPPGSQGDPCIVAFDRAVATGAQPFTVQGPRCPGAIDGGRTLGLELARQLDDRRVEPGAIYLQIGGGALATAVMDGLARAWPGRRLPRLHPVQAALAHPYVAGWQRLAAAILAEAGALDPGSDPERAEALRHLDPELVGSAIDRLGHLMAPWETEPVSVASGILDDYTHDWRTLIDHQVRTGGWPVLVEEAMFAEATTLARAQVEPGPDETGAAGLAGLLQDRRDGRQPGRGPSIVVLTGTGAGHRPDLGEP